MSMMTLLLTDSVLSLLSADSAESADSVLSLLSGQSKLSQSQQDIPRPYIRPVPDSARNVEDRGAIGGGAPTHAIARQGYLLDLP